MQEISIVAEPIFHIGSFPVTNSLLTVWAVVILLCLTAILISRRIKYVPGKAQNVAEIVIDSLLDFMANIAGGRKEAEKFFPVVATIFLLVLASNWFGILPGLSAIGIHEGDKFIPLFRSVNSDINMTLALALLTVVMSHLYGLYTVGIKHHLGKFFNFHGPINFFTGILEIIGEISKIISLSFRLFGNVFAGEVLLIIIGFLVPYIAPIPFLGLEIFVGFIQAIIFATIAMLAFSTFTKLEH